MPLSGGRVNDGTLGCPRDRGAFYLHHLHHHHIYLGRALMRFDCFEFAVTTVTIFLVVVGLLSGGPGCPNDGIYLFPVF